MLIVIFAAILLFALIFIASLSSRDRQLFLTNSRKSISTNGLTRYYLVSPAQKVDSSTRIVIGLHGFGDTPKRFAYYTGLHNAARQNDILVYPQASDPNGPDQKKGWNSSFCCGSGWVNKVDDVDFMVKLVEKVKSDYGVNSDKVYVAGFSNGAFMAQRLITDRPDIFKAAAAQSGTIGTTKLKLNPTTPTPILLIHGIKDKTVTFYGSPGNDPDFDWIPHAETLATWQKVNGDSALTKDIVHENDAHVWHDWRILNFWHRVPAGSRDVMDFFDSLK